ncbi:hypothetical protein CAEBREN_18988 [Caenorhabditis brenneri]|uniref:Sdz-33 F-box domain-containing protein n=1 Tax=Caenorhabditis brenneri TaxID=135651 RepID=G0NS32_CAEBE|nr:hypothetical protein CAEBREN_18988 [Caenorhabditis brenneri]
MLREKGFFWFSTECVHKFPNFHHNIIFHVSNFKLASIERWSFSTLYFSRFQTKLRTIQLGYATTEPKPRLSNTTVLTTMDKRFPFTRLPASCAKHVIRTMSPLQLLVYSHFLRIGFYESNTEEEMQRKKQLQTPNKVSCALIRDGRGLEICRWETNWLEVREWVEIFLSIFPDSHDIYMNIVGQAFQFDLDAIKEVFPNIHKLSIGHTGNNAFNQSVLQKLLPTDELTIEMDGFEHSEISHEFLIQNFTFTGVSAKVTLNELLINNSKKITMVDSQISGKDLNRFLKLWINGANPRLEYLQIFMTTGVGYTSTAALGGIACQKMPKTLTRTFKYYQGQSRISRIDGGVDFHRKDGTKATIEYENHPGTKCLRMMVWHDHCVG